MLLGATDGRLGGEAGAEEQEGEQDEWPVGGLDGVHEAEVTDDVGDVHDDHGEGERDAEARSEREQYCGEPLDAAVTPGASGGESEH